MSKRQTMVHKKLHRNLKIEQHEAHYNIRVNSDVTVVSSFPSTKVTNKGRADYDTRNISVVIGDTNIT